MRSEMRMRVLYIAPFPPIRSGIAAYAQEFFGALRQRVDVRALSDIAGRPCGVQQIVDEIARLHNAIGKWTPDVIHVETGYGLLREFYLLLSLPQARPYKVFATAHDAPCLAGEPLRFLVDGLTESPDMPGVLGPGLISEYSFVLERLAYHRTDSIMALTEKGRTSLKQQFGAHPGLRVVPHGVRIPPAQPKREHRESLRILCFGFIHEAKGIEVLLAALTRLRDLKLDVRITGEPYRLSQDGREKNDRYQRLLLAQVSGSGVTFLGYVPDDEVDSVFSDADVLVLPYRDCGLASTSGVLLRGMAHGLAVVAARVRALDESIVQGETGLLFEPGSEKGLARVLRSLANDHELAFMLGRAARAAVEKRHNWARIAKIMEAAYKESVAG